MERTRFKVGDIIEGTVTRVESYGAFFIFNGDIKGLLHISEMSNAFVADINKSYRVGNLYRTKIIEIDPFTSFMKLSAKRMSNEEKDIATMFNGKKETVCEEDVDFTKLKEELPTWIAKQLERGEKND